MTSSFDLPGGVRYMTYHFRAEAINDPAKDSGNGGSPTNQGKPLTQWVHLPDPSSPNVAAPPPPTKPADYVGQIVAVVVPSSSV